MMTDDELEEIAIKMRAVSQIIQSITTIYTEAGLISPHEVNEALALFLVERGVTVEQFRLRVEAFEKAKKLVGTIYD